MSTVAIDNLLTTEEAAKLIGCTEGRVCQLLREGAIKGKKFNERAWAVDRESAEKYRDAPQHTGRPRISA
jgi:excisionase family DNA binding protein